MPQSFILGAAVLTLALFPVQGAADPPHALPPLPPNTAVAEMPAPNVEYVAADIESTLHPESFYPTRVTIPSIRHSSPVIEVGVNAAGEMDVPDGSTMNVGWYRYGTVPGKTGSAVMDAHVYAAFKKLKYVKVGSEIVVENAKGESQRFRVISSKVYPLSQVPMQAIFNDVSGAYLNLITCEGKYSWRTKTYSHRRVVYAELIQ